MILVRDPLWILNLGHMYLSSVGMFNKYLVIVNDEMIFDAVVFDM